MKEITGDLLTLAEEGEFDIIIHGCNCFCTMGSGIARQIKEKYPLAYSADLKTKKGDINKLGNFTSVYVSGKFMIINAYTQFEYGTHKIQIDYEALTLILRKLNHTYSGMKIGLPQIGAGLAGGNWNKIKWIIENELKNMDVTIVYYRKDI